MRIHRGDILWLSILGAAVLFFLNIFVHLSSRRSPVMALAIWIAKPLHYRLIDKTVYFFSASSQNNKPLNLPSGKSNKTSQTLNVAFSEDSALLPFELRGTIIGTSTALSANGECNRTIGSPSLAFIYNSDTDKYAVYKLNDLIGEYKILNVRPGKVILGKSGATRELLLVGGNRKYAPDEEGIIFTDAEGTKLISKIGILSLIPHANELLRKVKILPVADNVSHKLLGFRLESVPSESIIEKAGIKSGDIIHSVEGRPLQSVQDMMQMLGIIRKQHSFEVVLLRQDKPVTLRYEFRN